MAQERWTATIRQMQWKLIKIKKRSLSIAQQGRENTQGYDGAMSCFEVCGTQTGGVAESRLCLEVVDL
jgi:hypothetical protein